MSSLAFQASRGKLSEAAGRKMFQQLIDAVTYCHNEGVIHRDLKVSSDEYLNSLYQSFHHDGLTCFVNCLVLQLENVLVDTDGNIKISDFGLSALPQHFRV